MRDGVMLTTTEAAALASVTPSTIKRWADQGRLTYARTVGGHRRFSRAAVESALRDGAAGAASASASGAEAAANSWVRCLIDGPRHELDGRLLEARARLGRWCDVADELAVALRALGVAWATGLISIAEEHVASDNLARALARAGDTLPTRRHAPRCALACAGDDEHTLGLSLAELCVREVGWSPLWLGRRTPLAEVVRLVTEGDVDVVSLCASEASRDAQALADIDAELGAACHAHGAGLVLGGAGSWPALPRHGVRLASFAAFRELLVSREVAP